jgi:hypothetical protein
MIYCTQVIGLLTMNGEKEALAALNRLDVARLNQVMAIVARFIRCGEGIFIRYLDISPMLLKSMANLGSIRFNKYVETLMRAVSECFSQTADSNIIFACCLVMPVEQRYSSAVQQSSAFAASTELMRNQGLDTLARAFPMMLLKESVSSRTTETTRTSSAQ